MKTHLHSLQVLWCAARCMASSATSRLLPLGSPAGVLRLVDAGAPSLLVVHRMRVFAEPLAALLWGAGGRLLAAATADARCGFMHTSTGSCLLLEDIILYTFSNRMSWRQPFVGCSSYMGAGHKSFYSFCHTSAVCCTLQLGASE